MVAQPSSTPSKPPATQAPNTQAPATQAPSTTGAQPSSLATSPAAGEVIKIGHIRPLTGVMAQSSDRMIKAFDWAFQQVNYQVAGKQIQIITGDSKADTSTALDVARKLVENDKVSLIVGPTQSGEAMAVSAYMEQVGIPMLLTNPGQPAGIIAQHRKWTIGGGGTQPEIASPMAVYAFEKAGYKKMDILTGDFAGGHGFMDAFMATYKKKGGQIVQETYTPYPTQDFAPYLTVLKPADAVGAWIDGTNAIKLLTQYHEMGIDKRLPLVGVFHGSFLAPTILDVLPPADADATIGDITPSPYSPLLDTPFNKKWAADYQAKFGVLPEDTGLGTLSRCNGYYRSPEVY